ncbi:MAG: peptide-methionine (S)-S-oxide reductase, partial [Phaeodactylibacter sp.]|nr:peptide-methionine (S)-S-oxide reductase [Phaeodactylibacter sp.]
MILFCGSLGLSGHLSAQEALLETATFGGGCFWCVEAVFQELIGVESAVSGYAGGATKNPSYKEV